MLHLMRLDSNFVRLWALYMAQLVYNDNVKNVAVGDPYYMFEKLLNTADGYRAVRNYMESFMVDNKKKDTLLVPYFSK